MTTDIFKKQHAFWLMLIAFCLLNTACNWWSDEAEESTKKDKIEKKDDLLAHCNNGLYDGDETGIDCGGSCPTDCCQNKKFDANLGEKGIDCGGKCPTKCCENGIVDATNGETGIDCGGPCPDCKEEKKNDDKMIGISKPTSPLKKDLEKDLNELAKQKDRKESRSLAKTLNKKYAGSQIVVVGKQTKTYSIRDYTKNLTMQVGTNIKVAVQNVQENEGKLNVATIKEKK